jgi:hypothetical protein
MVASPVTPAVLPGHAHQALDFGLGQVLARAQLAVRETFGGNCSIYGGWRDELEVSFGHALHAPYPDDCSDNAPFTNSLESNSEQY